MLSPDDMLAIAKSERSATNRRSARSNNCSCKCNSNETTDWNETNGCGTFDKFAKCANDSKTIVEITHPFNPVLAKRGFLYPGFKAPDAFKSKSKMTWRCVVFFAMILLVCQN